MTDQAIPRQPLTTAQEGEDEVRAVAKAMWRDDYDAMLAEAIRDNDQPNGQSTLFEVETMKNMARAAIAAMKELGYVRLNMTETKAPPFHFSYLENYEGE